MVGFVVEIDKSELAAVRALAAGMGRSAEDLIAEYVMKHYSTNHPKQTPLLQAPALSPSCISPPSSLDPIKHLHVEQSNQAIIEFLFGNHVILNENDFHAHKALLENPISSVIWYADDNHNFCQEYLDYFQNSEPIIELLQKDRIHKLSNTIADKANEKYLTGPHLYIVNESLDYRLFFNSGNLTINDIRIRSRKLETYDSEEETLEVAQLESLKWDGTKLSNTSNFNYVTSPYGHTTFDKTSLLLACHKFGWHFFPGILECEHKEYVFQAEHKNILGNVVLRYTDDVPGHLNHLHQSTRAAPTHSSSSHDKLMVHLAQIIRSSSNELIEFCTGNQAHEAGIIGAASFELNVHKSRLIIKPTVGARKELHTMLVIPRFSNSGHPLISNVHQEAYDVLEFDASGILVNCLSSFTGNSVIDAELIIQHKSKFHISDVIRAHLHLHNYKSEQVQIWNPSIPAHLRFTYIEWAVDFIRQNPTTCISFIEPHTHLRKVINKKGEIWTELSTVVSLNRSTGERHKACTTHKSQDIKPLKRSSKLSRIEQLLNALGKAKTKSARSKVSNAIREYYRENPQSMYGTPVSGEDASAHVNGLHIRFFEYQTYLTLSVEGRGDPDSNVLCRIKRYDTQWNELEDSYDLLFFDSKGNLKKVDCSRNGISTLHPRFILENYKKFDPIDVNRAILLLYGVDMDAKFKLQYKVKNEWHGNWLADIETALDINSNSSMTILCKSADGKSLRLPPQSWSYDILEFDDVPTKTKQPPPPHQVQIMHFNPRSAHRRAPLCTQVSTHPFAGRLTSGRSCEGLFWPYMDKGNTLHDFLNYLSKRKIPCNSWNSLNNKSNGPILADIILGGYSLYPYPQFYDKKQQVVEPLHYLVRRRPHKMDLAFYQFSGDLLIYSPKGELVNVLSGWTPFTELPLDPLFIIKHRHVFDKHIVLHAILYTYGLAVDSIVKIYAPHNKRINGNILGIGCGIALALKEKASLKFTIKGKMKCIDHAGKELEVVSATSK